MDNLTFKQNLQALTTQLVYSSESDFPYEVQEWGHKDPGLIKSGLLALYPAATNVNEIPVADFFSHCLRVLQADGDASGKDRAERYKKLQVFLSENVMTTLVWRIGKISIDIFLVIITENNGVFALKTVSIET